MTDGVEAGGHDVVKGMSTSGYAESPHGKENRKIDTGQGPKTKGGPVEFRGLAKAALNKDNVVVGTKQGGGDQDRQHHGHTLAQTQQVLHEEDEEANQN